MSRPCTACKDPRLAAIERSVAIDGPKVAFATFGISRASLYRHMAKCRGGALSPRKTGRPRATGALSSPPSTLAAVNPAFDHETARLRGELDGLLAKAKQDGSTSIALGTLSELRRLTMDRENIGIERAWLEQGPAHINVNVTAVRNVIAAMLDEIAKLPAKHRDRILKVIEGLPDDAA